MTFKVNTDKTAVVSTEYFWQPLETCPLSAKVQLLTQGGISVYGQYSKGQPGFLGWAPLPKKPEWMR